MIFGKIYWVGILSTNLATVSGFYIKVKRWLQSLHLLNRCQLCDAEILHHYSLLPVSVIYSFLYLVATRVLQYNNTALMGFHTFLELQTCQQQHQDWCPVTKQKATIKSGDLWTHSGYQASLILRSKLDGHQTRVAAHILITGCSHGMTVKESPSVIKKAKFTPFWHNIQVS